MLSRDRVARVAFVCWATALSGSCHDFNGQPTLRTADIIWQVTVPAFGPPAIDDNSVFFALQDHRLAAVNRTTGGVRWMAATGYAGDNLSIEEVPALAANVAVIGDEELHAFNAGNGARAWTFDGNGARPGIYPFRGLDNTIFAGSAVGAAFAIDATNGQQLWRSELVSPAGAAVQVRVIAPVGSRVFVMTRTTPFPQDGAIFSLESSTGDTVWAFRFPRAGGSANAARDALHTVDNGRALVVASFDDGRIVALDAGTGEQLWVIPRLSTLTTTDDWRTLTASGGILVASHLQPSGVAAYRLSDGSQIWQVLSEWGAAYTHLTADAEHVYVPFSNGYLGCYSLATGAVRWVYTPSTGYFFSGPRIGHDTLFVGAWDAAFALRK